MMEVTKWEGDRSWRERITATQVNRDCANILLCTPARFECSKKTDLRILLHYCL